MQKLTLAHQTMFADLVQRCQDAAFDEQFPEGGSFVRHTRRGRDYWYYVPSQRDHPTRTHVYVGPCDDPEIDKRVSGFRSLKASYRERRMLVSSLRGAGLPHPNPITGDVIEALWKAGFFRLRGVLVGTVAFQTYAGLLGARLPGTAMMTGDIDVAQFHSISQMVDDTMAPIGEVLTRVDQSFMPLPQLNSRDLAAAYRNDQGYKVEILTPNRGSNEHQGKLTRMPALSGGGAEPLRHLDFLIYQPVTSALLHKGGVPVSVPAPERFLVHKMIVASRRRSDGYAKAAKDLMQVELLIEAMVADRRGDDIGVAWMEAWERGPNWRKRLIESARRLMPQPNDALRISIEAACLVDQKQADDYGVLEIRL